jgi:hypothetical protein
VNHFPPGDVNVSTREDLMHSQGIMQRTK